MVALDAVVRVLLGVLERGRQALVNDREERPRPIGHNLDRLAIGA